MPLVERLYQFKPSSQLGSDSLRVVAMDRQATAMIGPVLRECRNDQVAPHWDGRAGQSSVSLPVGGRDEEVEQRAVVPDVEGSDGIHRGRVRDDPMSRSTTGRRPGPAPVERHLGYVQHRNVSETVLEESGYESG